MGIRGVFIGKGGGGGSWVVGRVERTCSEGSVNYEEVQWRWKRLDGVCLLGDRGLTKNGSLGWGDMV